MAVVRIPRTGGRNSKGYTKLIERVDSARNDGFAFDGRFMTPGALIDESAIKPPGWPDPPLLLEYVPQESETAARGWKAQHQPATHILWAWVAKLGEWREIARAAAIGAEWVPVLRPVALAHLTPPELVWRRTIAEARERIVAAVDAELNALEGGEGHRAALLSIVHDVIASRASFLPALPTGPVSDSGSGERVGRSGKNLDIPTKPSVIDFSLLSLPYMRGRNPQPTGANTPNPLGHFLTNTPNSLGGSAANMTAIPKKALANAFDCGLESDAVASTKLTGAELEVIRKITSRAGKASAASFTPEQRVERAKKANAARLAKRAAALQTEARTA